MSEEYKKQITQRLAKNLLDIQLLRLIGSQPTWGYKIKKDFEAELELKLRHGALYPTLNAMETKGLVESQRVQKSGRARKVYTLTAKGKGFLQAYNAVLREQLKKKSGS